MSAARIQRAVLGLLCLIACAVVPTVTTAVAAGPPTLGPVAATNIQGVSARLMGTVDPEGFATTYRFEYVDQAGFLAKGFTDAARTSSSSVGSGTQARPATADVSGLRPDTSYRFRLVGQNSAGTTTGLAGTFETTHGFGFLPGADGFAMGAIAEGGAPATSAGSHPYALTTKLNFNLAGEFGGQPGVPFSDGDLRNLHIEMPPGLVENPNAVSKCTPTRFNTPRSSPFEESLSGEDCPDDTQVGVVTVHSGLDGGIARRFGVFNLVPPPGVPSRLGFSPFGAPIILNSEFRPDAEGRYSLSLNAVNVPQWLNFHGLEMTIWGTPWGVGHNGERGDCLNEAEPSFPWAKCSVGAPISKPPKAYLSLPTSCAEPLAFSVRANSWQQPAFVSATSVSRDGQGNPLRLGDCDGLIFDPKPAGQVANTRASSPTGFAFDLLLDNEALTIPSVRVRPPTERVLVTLPEGITINPSMAVGLGGCSPGQYGAETAFSPPGAGCPNNSTIGDFTVDTPLFAETIEGSIFLAQPDRPGTAKPGAENPFDSLLAVYLIAKSPARGILIRVPGKLSPDPHSGQLAATFDNLPQLPYGKLSVRFREGQRAPLITPPRCGSYTTHMELIPSSGSSGADHTTFEFEIDRGPEGGSCPSGAPAPFHPQVLAGGLNSNVGSYTPFYLRLTRTDSEQELTSYSAVLPKGITGRLAGIPFCPDAQIAIARTRTGTEETESPSCPAASEVGHTVSGYGLGTALTYASGKVYLAGPYHGAPLSLVTINPATVGPFDLGTIVIRSAFEVDPLTAQLSIDSAGSDPIPHIMAGIPLHLRSVRINIDRPNFTRNPTSCEPSEVRSTLTGSGARFSDPSDDSTATAANHFQLLNCETLGFKPKLGLKLKGGTRRGDHPSLHAVMQARPGDANLKQIAVTIPNSLFLAGNHLRAVCTRRQFAAAACPARSIYGHATAVTPLFDEPLRGPVYLRSSSETFPDLVASLHSGAVHIVLTGRISSAKRGIRAQFNGLPDAQVTRFAMKMFGGKRGLLVNSVDICATAPSGTVKALAQNNLGAMFETKLRGQCKVKRSNR